MRPAQDLVGIPRMKMSSSACLNISEGLDEDWENGQQVQARS